MADYKYFNKDTDKAAAFVVLKNHLDSVEETILEENWTTFSTGAVHPVFKTSCTTNSGTTNSEEFRDLLVDALVTDVYKLEGDQTALKTTLKDILTPSLFNCDTSKKPGMFSGFRKKKPESTVNETDGAPSFENAGSRASINNPTYGVVPNNPNRGRLTTPGSITKPDLVANRMYEDGNTAMLGRPRLDTPDERTKPGLDPQPPKEVIKELKEKMGDIQFTKPNTYTKDNKVLFLSHEGAVSTEPSLYKLGIVTSMLGNIVVVKPNNETTTSDGVPPSENVSLQMIWLITNIPPGVTFENIELKIPAKPSENEPPLMAGDPPLPDEGHEDETQNLRVDPDMTYSQPMTVEVEAAAAAAAEQKRADALALALGDGRAAAENAAEQKRATDAAGARAGGGGGRRKRRSKRGSKKRSKRGSKKRSKRGSKKRSKRRRR
jgi:hypothetical protein